MSRIDHSSNQTDSTLTDWEYAPAPETTEVKIDPRYGLFVGGRFISSTGRRRFDTINPATETKISSLAESNEKDVDAAVASARKAFRGWSRTKPIERAKYLYRIARRIQERARELAILESMDGGKPIRESRDVDVPLVAQHFFHHAGWCDKLQYAIPGHHDPRPLGRVLLHILQRTAPAQCRSAHHRVRVSLRLHCRLLSDGQLRRAVVVCRRCDSRSSLGLQQHECHQHSGRAVY